MKTANLVTMHHAIGRTMREEMARDQNIVIWGEAAKAKIAADWPDLLAEFESRVYNMPIAESAIVGIGVGAAIAGLRPFIDIGFNDLLFRAMDDICNQAAKIRYMSGGRIRCPMVIKAEYSIPFSPQQSQFLEEVLFRIPGLRVVAPSSPADAVGLLKTALRCEGPVVFFEERRLTGIVREPGDMIPFGKALKLIEGDHITITAYSKLVPMCREIAEELAPKIRIEVLDLRSLSPLDYESVLESVHKTGRYLSVEIGCRTGGIGAELASAVAEDCASVLRAPVRRIAAPDSSFPASRALWKYLQPSKSEIVSAIKDLVKDEISY